jgi:hypothetical protein
MATVEWTDLWHKQAIMTCTVALGLGGSLHRQQELRDGELINSWRLQATVDSWGACKPIVICRLFAWRLAAGQPEISLPSMPS